MSRERFNPEHRRTQILETARNLSQNGGLYEWTLRTIADAIGISKPAVYYYYRSADHLRRTVILNAIRDRNVPIVVQALARYDPLVSDIDDALREACAGYMRDGEA